ncbi:MAG: YicC family protein [Hydrogenophaga sp.]|uniref:YicC/YloC family endoribonuclease n=1 Tax=Hydrogenophaga sp. TaxID=1904254 RepID=UPI001D516DFC|nr:YicC/YloC family endoribonuclease [Hydrogenophaga sp.]MBX3609164.1 YicC family protein [Hydrogenophaga sp.]
MAVYSMTGYATAQRRRTETPAAGDSGPSVGVELRSVNSRFLDLSFKLPDDLRAAEPALREALTQTLKRGKVELRGWFEIPGDAAARAPSSSDLQRLGGLQDAVRTWLPQAQPLSVAEVLQLTTQRARTPEDLHPLLLDAARGAIDHLLEARAREGERLAQSLRERVALLRGHAEMAAPLIPQLVAQQRQRFLDRWNEALGMDATGPAASSDAAQDRALSEATAYAIRIDVAEELTRLTSHLSEIDRLLARGGEVGKRLDFLIQELHREANTLGSKSSSLELTRISVDMKVLIEQMREQVQNLE